MMPLIVKREDVIGILLLVMVVISAIGLLVNKSVQQNILMQMVIVDGIARIIVVIVEMIGMDVLVMEMIGIVLHKHLIVNGQIIIAIQCANF
jgi:uncharacterized membrane protein HdeD (DUF308 family)